MPLLRRSKLRRLRKLSLWKLATREELEEEAEAKAAALVEDELRPEVEVERKAKGKKETETETAATASPSKRKERRKLETPEEGLAKHSRPRNNKDNNKNKDDVTNNTGDEEDDDGDEQTAAREQASESKRRKKGDKAAKLELPEAELTAARATVASSSSSAPSAAAPAPAPAADVDSWTDAKARRPRPQPQHEDEESKSDDSKPLGKRRRVEEVESVSSKAKASKKKMDKQEAQSTAANRRDVDEMKLEASTSLVLALRSFPSSSSLSSSSLRPASSSSSSSAGSSKKEVVEANCSSQSSTQQPEPAAPPRKLGASEEIARILAADGPLQVLGLSQEEQPLSEEKVNQAWKKLVLLLHPDKLQRLSEQDREAGASALHQVHQAKDELRQQSQARCAQVPARPGLAANPEVLANTSGQRKYEISWAIPESQDPERPIEKYEIWGPRHFSEIGEPYEWTLLATLPALQSSFVLVEEAPTQQDVMWAADRVLRPSLPISVHAVNGKGTSEALTFELPWATIFPWLQGVPSVMCSQCFKLSSCQGPWTRCQGCHSTVSIEQRIVVRCQQCQGEVLWVPQLHVLRCTCCLNVLGKEVAQAWRPGTKPMTPQPPNLPPPTYGRAHGQAPWSKRQQGSWQAW